MHKKVSEWHYFECIFLQIITFELHPPSDDEPWKGVKTGAFLLSPHKIQLQVNSIILYTKHSNSNFQYWGVYRDVYPSVCCVASTGPL